jgi:hypothetical protein
MRSVSASRSHVYGVQIHSEFKISKIGAAICWHFEPVQTIECQLNNLNYFVLGPHLIRFLRMGLHDELDNEHENHDFRPV